MGRVNTGPIVSGVYKITNNINGKFYIGQSVNIYYRFYEHIHDCDTHFSVVNLAIQKYGVENFSFEILEECDEEELFDKEKYYAEEVYNYKCYAPFGYNISQCGRGARKISWISRYDLEGNKIDSYYNMGDASRKLGISAPAIRQAELRNGLCLDSQWKHGLDDKIEKYNKPTYGIKINAYDAQGNLCLTFDNGVDAATYFGITTSAISSYVTHKSGYVVCGGYYLAKEGEKPVIRKRFKERNYNNIKGIEDEFEEDGVSGECRNHEGGAN